MKCSEVSPWLSEYVDDLLAPAARKLVEEHVATCEGCAAELASLKAYLRAMAGMEKVSAPPDFLATVHERIEQTSSLKAKSQEPRAKNQPVHERIEQASPFHRLTRWLFYPLRIKLPMELAGIALATLLLVFAYQTPKQEETKRVPARSSGVGQAILPAAEKEAALDKAAVTEPVSAPRRIELALLLSPPQTPGHCAQTPVAARGAIIRGEARTRSTKGARPNHRASGVAHEGCCSGASECRQKERTIDARRFTPGQRR